MSDFDDTKFNDLSMISDACDRRAIVLCNEVAPKAGPDNLEPDPAPYGVKFEYGDGKTWFRAKVHRVALIVRYEQIIECVDDVRVLKGIFRARLDEVVKVDRTLISWFSFDNNNNTWSPGDVVKPLTRTDGMLRIRTDLAFLLANAVQQYIHVNPVEKRRRRSDKSSPLNR